MENKILSFRPLPEGSRRNREQKKVYQPTQLELIAQQTRNKYLEKVDRIRHASINSLSPVPYNAWGIIPTK